ncbi:CD109 antigen-like, partial [Oppia nitens]|uniref:CD109 antigen-like n=1 Tax=Oppia nitens TaxID=1686743 RepID=UPI0023DA0C7A
MKSRFSFYTIVLWIAVTLGITGQQQQSDDVRQVLSLGDNDIVRNSDSFQYIPYQMVDEPRYLIVAPSQVRPGQVYRVVVNLLEAPFPLTISATVQCNHEEIAGATERIAPGDTQNLLMKIPFTARTGNYQLKVEGNANGVRGGNGFVRNTTIRFLPEFLTILIQTNQLVYNMNQNISIRVILLNMEMKPYVDAVDVYLLDSRGLIMKRWNSLYPFQGFITLQFTLPGDYPRGWWTVRVKALQQIEEKKILLERWFTNRFDVSISLPAFISQNDDYIEGTIYANHTNLLPVVGNATIRVILKPEKKVINWRVMNGDYDNYNSLNENDIFEDILKIDVVDHFRGQYTFRYNLKELFAALLSTPFRDKEIVIYVEIGERFYDTIVTGYARTRLINSTLLLRFLDTNPSTFKPGLPFETYIAISYSDSVPFPSSELVLSDLYITPSFTLNKNTTIGQLGSADFTGNSMRINFNDDGVGKIRLRPPPNIDRFTIKARFSTVGNVATTELLVVSFFSSSNRLLYITTSTENGQSGEYGIFHVYSNFYMKSFRYLVVSKGNVLFTGDELVSGMLRSVTTFSVALSPEMSPNCNVIVYHITQDGEIISDSVSLPIEGINKVQLTLKVNLNQDRSGDNIEFIPYLSKASIIGHNAVDADLEDIQGFNDITKATVDIAIRKFETRFTKKVIHKTREGINKKALYFLTHNIARDSGSTFGFNNLVVFTNLKISLINHRCNPHIYYNQTLQNQFQSAFTSWPHPGANVPNFMSLMCLTGNECYESHQLCDGQRDCADRSDELLCERSEERNVQLSDFIVYRKNRNNYFYGSSGNNFAWIDTFTSYNPDNYIGLSVPQRPVNWRFNAIGVGQSTGFSIMDEFVYWNSVRPFFITVEAPEVVVLGEQLGVRVAAFNYQPFEVRAEIILEDSDDYRFVEVGPMGRVSSYSPKISGGIHQHLIYIKPQSSFLVPVPVVPIKSGKIKIVITGRTQVAKDTKEIDVEVLADGAKVSLHTSLLLDLRAQSYIINFLDMNVTEDPIIPYQDNYRRYVFGSPKAWVTIIGDVVGVPAKLNPPIDFTDLGIGSTAKSGELRLFNFAYLLYTLIYLRLTNQLETSDKQDLSKQMLETLNKEYVHQMSFFRNGYFSMFDLTGTPGSVWLTAYAARVYFDAQYDDWHNFIYIDPQVIQQSIEFVLRHQIVDPSHHYDGSFYEYTPYGNWSNPRLSPVALTSHVLITLVKVTDVYGDVGLKISNAKQSSVAFLERVLYTINNTYEVSIATYALMIAGSPDAKIGFNRLEFMKRSTEGMVYWSEYTIKPQDIIYQSQRPYIQPRTPQTYESLAVEGTAYALMIYTSFGGLIQDQIVKWLAYMRQYDSGLVSTFDTIVAVQALTDYSFRTHVRSISNMKLEVEASSNPGNITTINLSLNNLTDQHIVTVEPNVWGFVTVTAKGAGMAIAQLTTQYNVDHDFQLLQPPFPAFDINVELKYSGRNKSRIAIKSCAKWLLTQKRNISGIAVMELTIPTGYWQHKAVIDSYVEKRSVRQLSEAKVLGRSATFMFDYLDHNWNCVDFTIERWHPVANLTRWLKARVYDLYEPEYFKEEIVDDFGLYALHICEVCGSYQCPYCPFFSSSLRLIINHSLILITTIIIII